MTTTTREFVEKLRRIRVEKGLSYQDIVNICESNNEPISISTVKRVFSKEPNEMEFRYDTTLQPIAKAVLGTDADFPTISLLDNATTETLEDNEMQTIVNELKAVYEARILDLWKMLDKITVEKRALYGAVGALIIFILYLFADGMHGNWGFFQYPT